MASDTRTSVAHSLAAAPVADDNAAPSNSIAGAPGDVKSAERIRKARVAAAKAAAVESKRQANISKAEFKSAKAVANRERADEDLELAEHGYKRSFWSGKAVPVRGSRRSRPHTRGPPRKHWWSRRSKE